MTKDIIQMMKLQRQEFNAADHLAKMLHRHSMTPVVDDDYPAVRRDYENALVQFIEAMKANGRFDRGNRYGLVESIADFT